MLLLTAAVGSPLTLRFMDFGLHSAAFIGALRASRGVSQLFKTQEMVRASRAQAESNHPHPIGPCACSESTSSLLSKCCRIVQNTRTKALQAPKIDILRRNGLAFVGGALLHEAGPAVPAKLLYLPPMLAVAESVLDERAKINWIGAV